MVLRFRIFEPDTSSPDYNFCGQGLNVLGQENLKVKVYVDNHLIFDEEDLSSYVPVLAPPIITPNNSIEITQITRIGDVLIFIINLPYIHSSTSVRIIAEKENYHKFDKTFKIFGYDLGNNPAEVDNLLIPIINNPDMDIVLIPSNIGNIYRAYSKFTYIREPYTNNIYLYNMSSILGKFNYHNLTNNTIVANSEDTKICVKEDSLISLTNIQYNENGVPMVSCNSEAQLIKKQNYFPSFYAKFGCINCSDECLSLINANTGSLFFDFDNLNYVRVGNTASYLFTGLRITYLIYDSQGNVVYSKDKNVDNITVPYNYNFVDTEVNDIILQSKGDYIAKVIVKYVYKNLIEDIYVDVWQCTYNTIIKGCDWFRVNIESCDTYTLVNNSMENSSVMVAVYNYTLQSFINKFSVDVPCMQSLPVKFNEDGIYKISTTRDGKTYTIILPVFCNLNKCYFDFVEKALCLDMCKCINKEYVYKANMFTAKYDIFMINLTKAGFMNTLYIDTEWQSKMEFIQRLDEILKSLYKYCQNCFKNLQDGCGCK